MKRTQLNYLRFLHSHDPPFGTSLCGLPAAVPTAGRGRLRAHISLLRSPWEFA